MKQNKKSLATDEGGFISWVGIALAGLLGVGGIAALSAINWEFLIATLILIIIALSVVGTIWFKTPFKYTIILSMICLGIVTFLQVGALVALGILVVGGTFYRFNPTGGRQLWIFVALIGLGLLAAIWGSQAVVVEQLGVYP